MTLSETFVPTGLRRRSRRFPGAPGLTSKMVAASVVVVVISMAVYPILPRYYAATADLVVQLTNNEGAPA